MTDPIQRALAAVDELNDGTSHRPGDRARLVHVIRVALQSAAQETREAEHRVWREGYEVGSKDRFSAIACHEYGGEFEATENPYPDPKAPQ